MNVGQQEQKLDIRFENKLLAQILMEWHLGKLIAELVASGTKMDRVISTFLFWILKILIGEALVEYVEIEVRQCYIQNMIFLWSSYQGHILYAPNDIDILYSIFRMY